MITNCQDNSGNVWIAPVNGCVNKTFIVGLSVNTITFDIVAKATMILSDSG